jgi:hypothetical protein
MRHSRLAVRRQLQWPRSISGGEPSIRATDEGARFKPTVRCRLLATKRTNFIITRMSANDPKQTLRVGFCQRRPLSEKLHVVLRYPLRY